jgi:hypothetical protein
MSWGDWNGSNPEYEKGSPLGLNGRCAEAIKRALVFWAGSDDSLVRTFIESPPQKACLNNRLCGREVVWRMVVFLLCPSIL